MLFFEIILDDILTENYQNLESKKTLNIPDNSKDKINPISFEEDNIRLRDMMIYYFKSFFENFYFKEIE